MQIEFFRLTATLSTELTRIYTAARHDIDSLYSEIAAKDRLFDLNIFQYGVNVMSSISGSAVSPPDPGSAKSGLGGALSGALAGGATGAMLGSAFPGVGTVAGAGVGAAVGLAGGLLQ